MHWLITPTQSNDYLHSHRKYQNIFSKMMRHRSARHHKSTILRSTPDLSADSKSDKSPVGRNSWRTHSAVGPPKSANPDAGNRLTDSSPSSEDHSTCSPSRRPRALSPHHNRSLSFRTMKRPTTHQIQCEDSGCTGVNTSFRPRGSTMPSDSASYYLARRRIRRVLLLLLFILWLSWILLFVLWVYEKVIR